MTVAEIPRLRGVFHLWAFVAALAAGTTLVVLADGVRERVAVWVYAAALAAMFGASALYHRFPWRTAAARLRARRLDHAMIFVFIAGTYTPFALLGFDGFLQAALLIAVWGGALIGLVLNLAWIGAPRGLSLFGLGVAAAVLVVCGAGLYTLGALAYATAWPNPFPATFGFHEVFHLLVVAAAIVQFVAVALVVL